LREKGGDVFSITFGMPHVRREGKKKGAFSKLRIISPMKGGKSPFIWLGEKEGLNLYRGRGIPVRPIFSRMKDMKPGLEGKNNLS